MTIIPYKRGSKSYRLLRNVIRSRQVLSPKKINWGCSSIPMIDNVINKPTQVAIAIDKVTSLSTMSNANVRTPKFTTNKEEAMQWLADGRTVVCRTKTKSKGGEGIIICDPEEGATTLPDAPLYTRYLRKKYEYRIHVFNGEVIDYAQKKAKRNRPVTFSKYVRSYNNGWVFCRTNLTRNDSVCQEAIKAVNALGLDFGAVDVCWFNDKPWVLEVNTAPGLQGSTLNAYVKALEDAGIISCQ